MKDLIDLLKNQLPAATRTAADAWNGDFGDLPTPGGGSGGRGGGRGAGSGDDGGGSSRGQFARPGAMYLDGRRVGQVMLPVTAGLVTRMGLTR